jgi:hypothetical protein
MRLPLEDHLVFADVQAPSPWPQPTAWTPISVEPRGFLPSRRGLERAQDRRGLQRVDLGQRAEPPGQVLVQLGRALAERVRDQVGRPGRGGDDGEFGVWGQRWRC